MKFDYERDPAEIYRKSFGIIEAEAGLERFAPELRPVLVRMIHACGMTDLGEDLVASPGCIAAARSVLEQAGPVLVDARMVEMGMITARFPRTGDQASAVRCLLGDHRVPDLAARLKTTRSAAQVELWREHLDGALVVIGNAPTALFHLLEMIAAGGPKPAVIFGFPVGFVGAAESREALAEHGPALGVEFLTLRGRRGGSAIAAAAVNALSIPSDSQSLAPGAPEAQAWQSGAKGAKPS